MEHLRSLKIFGANMRVFVVVAVALRLGILLLPPFSTDTQRFLADGNTLLSGRNPYNSAPPAAIEYAHLRSFYPPLQEVSFAALAAIHPKPIAIKFFAGLVELAFVLWILYRKRKRPLSGWLVAFLLFNPLSLHEVWREGHLDHIAAFFLYLAVVAVRPHLAMQKPAWRAYSFAALSIAWKFFGIFASLWQYRNHAASPLWRILQILKSPLALLSAAFFALQIAPAFVFTPFAERGLTVYVNYWHHGNAIVHALEAFGFSPAHAVWLIQRGIVALVLVTGLLYIKKLVSFANAYYFALGSLVVLFPVQHPWYYFLLFPGVLLSPSWRGLLMLLCTLAPLSYLGYSQNFKSVGFVITTLVWFAGAYRVLKAAPPPRRA